MITIVKPGYEWQRIIENIDDIYTIHRITYEWEEWRGKYHYHKYPVRYQIYKRGSPLDPEQKSRSRCLQIIERDKNTKYKKRSRTRMP